MCVEQEVRCTGCNESSTSVYICSKLKRWQRNHKKIVSHRRCGEFSISRPRKQTSLAHMDCPIVSKNLQAVCLTTCEWARVAILLLSIIKFDKMLTLKPGSDPNKNKKKSKLSINMMKRSCMITPHNGRVQFKHIRFMQCRTHTILHGVYD